MGEGDIWKGSPGGDTKGIRYSGGSWEGRRRKEGSRGLSAGVFGYVSTMRGHLRTRLCSLLLSRTQILSFQVYL